MWAGLGGGHRAPLGASTAESDRKHFYEIIPTPARQPNHPIKLSNGKSQDEKRVQYAQKNHWNIFRGKAAQVHSLWKGLQSEQQSDHTHKVEAIFSKTFSSSTFSYSFPFSPSPLPNHIPPKTQDPHVSSRSG